MIVRTSARSHAQTLARLRDALGRRGLSVFATIDHSAAAREVGMELGEEIVLLFGNPRAGTPLMQSDPRVGVELPLRILIWQAGKDVLIAYNDPRELEATYRLEGLEATLEQMAGLLEELAAEAAG